MPHALIIDDNLIVSRIIIQKLAEIGFDSFDCTWTEDQAVLSAANITPDLVVVGDALEEGSGMEAARRISLQCHSPVIMVTGDCHRAKHSFEGASRVEGPFLMEQIGEAIDLACQSRRMLN